MTRPLHRQVDCQSSPPCSLSGVSSLSQTFIMNIYVRNRGSTHAAFPVSTIDIPDRCFQRFNGDVSLLTYMNSRCRLGSFGINRTITYNEPFYPSYLVFSQSPTLRHADGCEKYRSMNVNNIFSSPALPWRMINTLIM